MRDVIWTIIAVWVIYRIYQAVRSTRTYVFQKHDHHYNTQQKDGEVKIDKEAAQTHQHKKPNSDKGGEYVDFEEIK